MTEDEVWRTESIARTKKALFAADAPADRLALLRELTRLEHGWLSLAAISISLSSAERKLLGRFGLIEAGDGTRLLLNSSEGNLWSRELTLDTALRRPHAPVVADAALLRLSPHRTYQNETQKAALRAMMTMPPAATLIVSMPTGSGKSLLFQIGPKWWTENGRSATVVVIVPTIALGLDHERTLSTLPGLEKSKALSSQLSTEEREEVLRSFRRGEVPVLLLSPEMAMGEARSALIEAARPPEAKPQELKARLAAFFIDEAHIIHNWGNSFRPEFQRLAALVESLLRHNPDLRTILLSATLSPGARDELRRAYGNRSLLEFHAGVPRYELDIDIHRLPTAALREQAILDAVDHVPRPAIVYTSRVPDARKLYDRLCTERGYRRVALFHGDLESQTERERIITLWARDELDLVVATSAFGLGIDKRNVRAVLHACLPESPARYYQEIGRAARDGHQGLALTIGFHANDGRRDDERVAFELVATQWLTKETAMRRWAAIVKRLSDQEGTLWDEATQKRRLCVPLDAAHDGIVPGPNDYNRRWNMSLLNLLQRAGGITICTELETKGSPVWEAVVDRPELLETGAEAEAFWDGVFRVRDAEQSIAVKEMREFRDIMLGLGERCLLSSVFELIEPDAGNTMPCGRCPNCRRVGIEPPSEVWFAGLDRVWPSKPTWSTSRLPSGLTFFHPHDPEFTTGLCALLGRLVSVGVEQVIVPDGLGPQAGELLSRTPVRAGLLLEWHDLLSGAALANLPTAVLLHSKAPMKPLLDRLIEWMKRYPAQSFALVAGSGCLLCDRPLEQVVARTAPYLEDHLDRLNDQRECR